MLDEKADLSFATVHPAPRSGEANASPYQEPAPRKKSSQTPPEIQELLFRKTLPISGPTAEIRSLQARLRPP